MRSRYWLCQLWCPWHIYVKFSVKVYEMN
jgi:hypothetical protein